MFFLAMATQLHHVTLILYSPWNDLYNQIGSLKVSRDTLLKNCHAADCLQNLIKFAILKLQNQ